jgi:isocitrate dehydrogenase
MSCKVTVAYGDGIGPEIMAACLKIIQAAGADLELDPIEIGENTYLQGHTSGIKPEDWEKIVNNKVLYKAPITTPQGGGYKSLNVTLRKTLGLFANVRPVKTLSPYVFSKHSKMDTVIIRENEEDLYAGIEHRQTQEVFQCLKLISRPGSEKIVRFAFEYAKSMGRKKITCMTKDNIMKLTDGEFHKVFDEVAKEYPSINTDHWIIDIGTAKLADTPEDFDVIVLPNLYGDVLSDVAAQVAGSVGLAGSSNIGNDCAMFEAIHGSAPTIAGQNLANPSGLLMGGLQMLTYLGMNDIAEKIENAWLKTVEEGIHTFDIFNDQYSTKKVSTSEFADQVIHHLGERPSKLKPVEYPKVIERINVKTKSRPLTKKTLDGIDVFLDHTDRDPNLLGERLTEATKRTALELKMITNRGIKVFPDGNPLTFCTDHWRCRFMPAAHSPIEARNLLELQEQILECGFEIIKTENLYSFDGKRGYSLGQGQ